MEDTKVRKRRSVGTIPKSTPLQSQTSPLEILVLDASPKPIRKRMSMPLALLHEDEETELLPSPHDSNTKLDSPDHIYENTNFKLPIVETKIFPSEEKLYEEVRRDDGGVHIYDLTQICDGIPGKVKDTKVVNNDHSHSTHKLAKKSPSFTEKPQFPRQHKYPITVENSYYISTSPRASPTSRRLPTTQPSPITRVSPTTQESLITRSSPIARSSPTTRPSPTSRASSTSTTKSKPPAPVPLANANSNTDVSKESSVTAKRSSTASRNDPATTAQPHHNKPPSVPSGNAAANMAVYGSKEENVAYLRTLSLDNILQLLDNMNFGEYKGRFKDERIDGEIIVHLDKGDLVELGVNKNIHQTRLLKLIDGTISTKKYQYK